MGTCASAPPDAVSPRGASSLDDVAVEVTTNPGQPTAEQPPQQPDARQGGGGSDGPASQQAQRAQRDQGGEQKGPLMLDAAVPAPPSLTAATATGGSSGDAAPHRRAAAAAAAPLHVFDFSVPILNTARGEVCNKYRMSTDGVYQVASPSSASSRATQPQDEHFSPRHDFQSHEDQGKTLYQANAEAIVEVITLAVREGRLPTRVQGHIWELCCCLGYLSCDCSRACTGKFQTVLEEFSGLGLGLGLSADIGGGGGGEGGGVVGGSRAVRPQSVDRSSSGSSAGGMGAAGSPKQPAAGELSLLRATSVPTQVVTQSERGRRKSLSQADVLRKQRQARARFKTKGSHFGGLSASSSSRRLGKARSGRLRGRGSGSGSGSDTNMGPPSAMRLESDTSETDDWDVGEDVQVAEEGEDMLAIIDEPFSAVTSAHNSPKKKLLHLQLLRAVRVAVETELLQAPDADAGGGGGGGGGGGAGAECTASTFAGSEPSTVGAGAGPPAAGGGRGGRGRQQLAQTCRCVGVVAEATGPLKYMEDRHVCLNADPFTVYKLGIGSEELTAVQQSPAAHNPVYEALYGVIDGHGGELVAESLFIDFPRLLVQHPLFRTDAKRAVLGTCETVDRRYVQQSVDVTMDQSGAVATFVLIRGNKLLCASVGDCRAVLSTSGGFAIALTHDHTLANSAERARVERTDAKISRGRIFGDLVVTRSFGDARHKPLTCHRLTATGAGAGSASTGGALRAGGTNCGGATGSGGGAAAAATAAAGGLGDDEHEDDRYDYITALPEITSRVIQPSDEFLIMASDGLWDVFTSQAAVDYVRAQFAEARRSDQTIRAEDVARAAKKLIKEAQRKGSRDNVTVTIVCLWVRTVDPNLLSSSDSESDSGEADEIVEY